MQRSNTFFFRLGSFVYRHRKSLIGFWIVLVFTCVPFLSDIIHPFKSAGFVADGSKSDKADRFLDRELDYGHNQFIIIYHSPHLIATDPEFLHKMKQSLSGLKHIWIKHEIIYPQEQQISKDKHTAYVIILLKSQATLSDAELKEFTNAITTPKAMNVHLGGEPIFIDNINEQTQSDLFKSDMIATPMSIITLLVIFGTVIATLIPIGIGACCAVIILTTLYTIGHLTTLSIFTLNIALLLGLCLSLDYALFIINRFRDELLQSKSVKLCIETTLATAGKAVFFSGLAVFISLSALLFFPINILFSIGIGGLVAVLIAVISALTLLPAILSVLGQRINKLAIRKLSTEKTDAQYNKKFWYKIAHAVVKNPGKYFVTTLFFLLLISYTVIKVKVGISDFQVLSAESSNQIFFNTYDKNFNQQELNPILLIATTQDGNILSSQNLSQLYDFVNRIKQMPEVADVNSIVSLNPNLHKHDYKAMYQNKVKEKHLKQFLTQSTRHHFTVIKIISRYSPDSPKTKALISKLYKLKLGNGLETSLTGTPVINAEVLSSIAKVIPYAALWVFSLTYIVLLILLRSLFLPFKAIFMNVLSLCASYGVLVYIFQEGHFHTFLHFNPQGILDINLIIIIFCALFGFSMDYEVFLLTRIHEAYISTRDNDQSIIFGIVKSSRIITSAALIVIVLCGSFMFADVIMVKQFGLGIAVAIFVDAFAIRTILVPATMALVKKWNWYLPKWLNRIL